MSKEEKVIYIVGLLEGVGHNSRYLIETKRHLTICSQMTPGRGRLIGAGAALTFAIKALLDYISIRTEDVERDKNSLVLADRLLEIFDFLNPPSDEETVKNTGQLSLYDTLVENVTPSFQE